MIRSIEDYQTFVASAVSSLEKGKTVSLPLYYGYSAAVVELFNVRIFMQYGPTSIIERIHEIRKQLGMLCSLPVSESTFLQRLYNAQIDRLQDRIAVMDEQLEYLMNLDSEDGAL